MARIVKRWPVLRLDADGGRRERADQIAGEEPLEIRVGASAFSVTMRTPGSDLDLVIGFLVSEGVIRRSDQVRQIAYDGLTPQGERDYNVVSVHLSQDVVLPDLARHVYTTSSCGVCGTASIEAIRKTSAYPVADDDVRFTLADLLALPQRLRERQEVFGRTGGVHAAALFTADDDGAPSVLCVREDVGRHNAVDKVVGWALREDHLPLRATVLQVSGRASFELVQKAAMAGVPVLSAVSAPSALAVELAQEVGLTLVAFNRGDRLNVYTGAHRVVSGTDT
ncbi:MULTISPECIES: formate dehydrogenase accessory sulfurtransferase FdhD [unclassified Pseudactinotalea]|uniref:formate dehydrogenase accessory sulfurtransferase FdhD n=1 Tax=Micrococcales TaxID=85006 RepID=UPI003C7E81FF